MENKLSEFQEQSLTQLNGDMELYIHERKRYLNLLQKKGEDALYFVLKKEHRNKKIKVFEDNEEKEVGLKKYVESLKEELKSNSI